jgi:DNA-binding CsgD family transcriptional regulator
VLAARLVGRQRELDVLEGHLTIAAQGGGDVVFVLGEAGIGKSRIAKEASTRAEDRGLVVARGRAVHTHTPVPYRALTEALCSAVRRLGVPDVPELVPFRGVLGRVIPDWHATTPEPETSVVVLSEGVLRLLRVLAGDRGCLLVLEDLHWADPETLSVVEYLADNVAGERILVLATARSDERSSAVELIRALAARRTGDVVELARLTESEVTEMVTACLAMGEVPPEVVEFTRRSDGVPFLIEELLSVAVTSGALVDVGGSWSLSSAVDPVVPLTFADTVRRRLALIGSQPRAVVLAAAVLGRSFDWGLLPDITGLDRDGVVEALHAAVDAQLLAVDPDDGSFRFRHALSRDAVLAELLPPETAALSSRALSALEAHQPGLPGEACERAAELARQAGDRRRAAELLLEVGQRALAAGALSTSEAALDSARGLAPDTARDLVVAIESCLAEVLSLAGKLDRSVEVCDSLLRRLGAEPAGAAHRGQAHLRLARADSGAARFADAQHALDRARAEADAAGDEALLARVDALAAHVAMGLDRTDDAASLAQRALDGAQRLQLEAVACEALEVLGRCARPRDLAAAEQAFARAHAIADEHELNVWRTRALHELGTIDLLAGRGTGRLETARDAAFDGGALATAAIIDVQIAAALSLGDDPEQAMTVARRAGDLAHRFRLNDTLATALVFEALAQARLDRPDQVDRCEQAAYAATPDSINVTMISSFARGVLALVHEDRAEATHHLERAAAIQASSVGDRASGPIEGLWALLAVVGNLPDAEQLARPAEEPVHYLGRAYLQYARAVLAARREDHAIAEEHVSEADHLLHGAAWFRHYGRRLVADGAPPRWQATVGWLREALAFFDANGDDRTASACRSLLRRAGVAVPRRRAGGDVPGELRAAGVTGREVEVLQLLAEGLTNQQIATRLYLSPRTVERHIANLTVKTGVERRAQLVALAARSLRGG